MQPGRPPSPRSSPCRTARRVPTQHRASRQSSRSQRDRPTPTYSNQPPRKYLTIRTEDCSAGQAFHHASRASRTCFLRDDHAMLRDGRYNVFIVDAEHASEQHDALRLELAVTDGPHKGDVVNVIARHMHVDAVNVLGLPATLIVEDGE